MNWAAVFENPRPRWRHGWNSLPSREGVAAPRVWFSGGEPTSVEWSTDPELMRGASLTIIREVTKLISEWLGTKIYLTNIRRSDDLQSSRYGKFRADVSIDPLMRENPVPRSALNKAVEEMRRYLGSIDYAPVLTQQRLHDRVMKRVQDISAKTGVSAENAWNQIEREARRRGVVRVMPGRDY